MCRVMEVGIWEAPVSGFTGAQQLTGGKLWLCENRTRGKAGRCWGPCLQISWSVTSERAESKQRRVLDPPEHEGAPLWANCANNTVSTGWACKQVSLGSSFAVAFPTTLQTLIPLPPQDNRLCGLLPGSGEPSHAFSRALLPHLFLQPQPVFSIKWGF